MAHLHASSSEPPSSTHNRSTYQCYPFLTSEEFAEVCHYFDAKYCRAPLGPLRKQWRLDLHTALDTTATSHNDLVTYLQITIPLENNEVDDQLASSLGNVALGEPSTSSRRSQRLARQDAVQQPETDSMMIDMEEADKEVVRYPLRSSFQSAYVVYEIHLHPTYRVPCLWFTLHNLPIDESPLDLDSVFRHLIPSHFPLARSRGQFASMGGISIDHHPITGVPAFFVHPCVLPEIMGNFDCSKEDYLSVWLVPMGELIGLRVPREIAMESSMG